MAGSLPEVQGWHPGERQVQEAAGFTAAKAQAMRQGMIQSLIPQSFADFLLRQPWAIVSTVDAQGYPWASLLTGAPGFLQVPAPDRLEAPLTAVRDPALLEHLAQTPDLGLLALEPVSRQRLRLNGRGRSEAETLVVTPTEVFGNCPKYIQKRQLRHTGSDASDKRQERAGQGLSQAQVDWVQRADTFFIASRHRDAGADASHRGGNPGFVQAQADRLTFPDYMGNFMFQTLGNLALEPKTSLLFPDFQTGSTLLVLGRATIDHDPERAATVPGAQRMVDVAIERVIETQGAFPLRGVCYERSPYNPRLES